MFVCSVYPKNSFHKCSFRAVRDNHFGCKHMHSISDDTAVCGNVSAQKDVLNNSKCVSLLKRWYLNGDVEDDKDSTLFSDTIQFLDGVRN